MAEADEGASAAAEPHVAARGAPLVVDVGCCTCKAGFAGEDAPCAVFPTLVGRPKRASINRRRSNEGVAANLERQESMVGIQAVNQEARLSLKCPMERGLVTNWDDM